AAGLALIGAILERGELRDYVHAHSARADLYRRLGKREEARVAYRRALELARAEPQRGFIQRRLAELGGSGRAAGKESTGPGAGKNSTCPGACSLRRRHDHQVLDLAELVGIGDAKLHEAVARGCEDIAAGGLSAHHLRLLGGDLDHGLLVRVER